MKALDRKLLRELWSHRGQLASIAAVVATGVMTVLTMRGTYDALERSRDAYYRDARFPDVWAQVERAPESLARRIRRRIEVRRLQERGREGHLVGERAEIGVDRLRRHRP